jgi:4-hydroxy-tetrahydrodipicolinate reductase
MIKLGISGCQGRMGQKILGLATVDPAFRITVLLEHPGHPKANETIQGVKIATDNNAIKNCDVFIEFTVPEATLENLKACVRFSRPIVIGTTGMPPEAIATVKEASKKIPIVYSSNMSIGVNVLFKAAEIVAAKLQGLKDITVYEEHHIHKKDKPSGTAKTIAEIVTRASGFPARHLEPLRQGEIIGNHELTFETQFDTLKMSHHAKDRAMFARGALAAAKFIVGKKPGLFDMLDVLELKGVK